MEHIPCSIFIHGRPWREHPQLLKSSCASQVNLYNAAMVTKRNLGVFMLITGLSADIGLLLLGRLGAGAWHGIGPLETALLCAGLGFSLLGIPLLKSRDIPAATKVEPSYVANVKQGPPLIRWLTTILWITVLAAFVGYLVIYFVYAIDLFKWPYDYDQGESFELYDAYLHSQGIWPYRDSSIFPFYSSNYPPVFHLINVLLFPIFGPTLLSGRILSFTITLLTAGLIGLTVRRRTGGLLIPIVSGLAYTASNFVYHVGPLCRQQLTMVFWETLSVFFIAGSSNPKNGKRNLMLGLFCLFLAGYTKQLAVFTAAAVFGYLFLLNPKRALFVVGAFGIAFGLVFLSINYATDGYWWVNTISANVNEFILSQLIGLSRSWFKIHPFYIICAVAMTVYEVYIGRISIYSIWFIFALGTGAMSGKWGAGEAYWITSVTAAIILSGFALGKVKMALQHKPGLLVITSIIIPIMLILQTTRMLHLPTEGPVWGKIARVLKVESQSAYADYPYYDAVGYSQVGHLMLARDYEGGRRIMAYVTDTEGLVLSEEAAFTMLSGKPVIGNPTQLLNLYNNQLLDISQMESMIRKEEFGLIIMRAQFYPPPILAAIGQHYGLVEHIPMNGFNYIIMKPLGQPER